MILVGGGILLTVWGLRKIERLRKLDRPALVASALGMALLGSGIYLMTKETPKKKIKDPLPAPQKTESLDDLMKWLNLPELVLFYGVGVEWELNEEKLASLRELDFSKRLKTELKTALETMNRDGINLSRVKQQLVAYQLLSESDEVTWPAPR